MIRLTVNGNQVEVEAGATLLEAARAAGVQLPSLCYHPRLPARASCRLCLVQVQGGKAPQAACVTAARAGDVVDTDTLALQEFRAADAAWLLARHPDDCLRCEVSGACRLQTLVRTHQWEDRWDKLPRGSVHHPEHPLTDHTSPSIRTDLSKCIECGLCVDACGEPGQQLHVIGFAERGEGRIPVTAFDRPLVDTDCISCGQCTWVCPVGALIEVPHWHDVLHVLDARRRTTVVQVAPATRIAIGEEFAMQPGTISTGRMINALRALGFDYVFDTNFAADLTVMEEATELLTRLQEHKELPLFTSCCPGWITWVELHRPDLLPHLSTSKSPQQMHGALAKRSAFARSLGAEFAEGRSEPYVVSVMPCTAKKDEAERPGHAGDIDRVLTTRELARMIKARGIAFNALSEDGEFDSALGASSGAAQIFGASGGVMEAIARSAAHLLGAGDTQPLEWHAFRGVNESVKTAEIPGLGRVAVCNGIATAQQLLQSDDWRDEFVAIEVMACVGGCLGGGGEPKSMDPQVLEKRMRAVYEIDRNTPRRRSFENPEVEALYAREFGRPNSPEARALLHTSYAVRNSKRLMLMRFLDCVDRRDGTGAVGLLHPEASWSTASPYGELHGAAGIAEFIDHRLPPRSFGPAYARHRMRSASDPDDLCVIAATGEPCRFDVELDSVHQDGRSRTVIRRLVRHVG
jgi:iron-only hydrogenase group A